MWVYLKKNSYINSYRIDLQLEKIYRYKKNFQQMVLCSDLDFCQVNPRYFPCSFNYFILY
jgi:hypothetical protein